MQESATFFHAVFNKYKTKYVLLFSFDPLNYFSLSIKFKENHLLKTVMFYCNSK